MKKLCILFIVFACILSLPAFADDALTVSEKTWIELDGEWNSWNGYFFAKVQNDGNEAINLGSGKLVGFSENDDIILSENYVSSYPSRITLQPGEYVYYREYVFNDSLETNDVADIRFSVETASSAESVSTIPCEVTYEINDSYDSYVYVTFSNESDDILYDTFITIALYDTDGNLMFVDGDSISALGVHPNSTVTIKASIDGDLVDYYAENEIEISSADAFVYQAQE